MFRLLIPTEFEEGNGEMLAGEFVEIEEYIGDWNRVRSVVDGQIGYVHMRDLEETEQ